MIDETRFYSVAELKTETNAPRDLIYASLESGELHAIRRGRRWLIPGGAVLEWIRLLGGPVTDMETLVPGDLEEVGRSP